MVPLRCNSLDDERQVPNSSFVLSQLRQLLADHDGHEEWRLPPERDLAISLNVGRRAVRRAMEILEAEGLIWRHQGKGTFSGKGPALKPQLLDSLASQINPIEVMEVRMEIEPALARLAAMRASPEQIVLLHRLVAKTAQAESADNWERWDSAFHRQIAEASSNRLMLALFDFICRIRQEPFWRRARARAYTQARHTASVDEHNAIMAAIANRDAAAAERAMRRHLGSINADLQSLMLGTPADGTEDVYGNSQRGLSL
jgi:DNA-binding FadR family transcriptional regulator